MRGLCTARGRAGLCRASGVRGAGGARALGLPGAAAGSAPLRAPPPHVTRAAMAGDEPERRFYRELPKVVSGAGGASLCARAGAGVGVGSREHRGRAEARGAPAAEGVCRCSLQASPYSEAAPQSGAWLSLPQLGTWSDRGAGPRQSLRHSSDHHSPTSPSRPCFLRSPARPMLPRLRESSSPVFPALP